MHAALILLVGVVVISFAAAKSSGVINPGDRRGPSAAGVSPSPAPRDDPSHGAERPSTACLSAEEISGALRKLTSENNSQISEARTLLHVKANESGDCRGEVVAALMKAMDRPDLDFDHDEDSYYLWRHGADTIQQFLNAGLLNEISVDIGAILLGSGVRLFDHLAGTSAVLGNPTVIAGVGVTHLRHPVRKA